MTRRLVAAGSLVLGVHAALWAAEPLTVRQFIGRIDDLAVAVRQADAASAARLAAAVPASERVVAGSDTYDVPLDWLRGALEAAPESGAGWSDRRRQLVIRLEGVSAEARLLDDGARSVDAARDVLTNVLADRRYARARTTPWQTVLLERIKQWIADLLLRTVGPGWGPRRLVQVIAWTLSSAAVLVLIVWLTRVSLRRRADRPIGVGPVGAVVPPGHVLALEAVELIRAGRVREGAQVAYRAALRRLEEEGVLRTDAASTPRETLRLVAPTHRRAAPLAALTAVFERIWYGSRPAGHDEGSRLLGLLRDLECLPSDRAK
jgi:Domain of unknown function (DUF4129)